MQAWAQGETTLQCEFCGVCGVQAQQVLKKAVRLSAQCNVCSQPLETISVPKGEKRRFDWKPKVTMTNCPVCKESKSEERPIKSCRCCGLAKCSECIREVSKYVPGYIGCEVLVCTPCVAALNKEDHLEVTASGRLADIICTVVGAENGIRQCKLITHGASTSAIPSWKPAEPTVVVIVGYVNGVEVDLKWDENMSDADKAAFKRAYEELWRASTPEGDGVVQMSARLLTAKDPKGDAELLAFVVACYLKHKLAYGQVQCDIDPLAPDWETVYHCDKCCLRQASQVCELCQAKLEEPVAWHFRIDPLLPADTPVEALLPTLQYNCDKVSEASRQKARIAKHGHVEYCNGDCGGGCAAHYSANAASNITESVTWGNEVQYTLALHAMNEVTLTTGDGSCNIAVTRGRHTFGNKITFDSTVNTSVKTPFSQEAADLLASKKMYS